MLKTINNISNEDIELLEDTLIELQKKAEKSWKSVRTQNRKLNRLVSKSIRENTNIEELKEYKETKNKRDILTKQARWLELQANTIEKILKELSPQGYRFYYYYIDVLS